MSTANNNTNNTIMTFYELINAGKITKPTPFTYEDVKSICYPFNYWEFPMTMDILMRFCNGAKYIEVFGEDIVKKAMPLIKFRDVVKEDKVEENMLPYYLKQCGAYLIDNERISYKDTIYRGDWSKEVPKKGYKIIHASPYQHWEGDFLKNCLMLKFPYLTNFKLDCYHLSSYANEYDDFYVRISNPENPEASVSLYCPVLAFIKGDFSIIEKRMHNYFNQYYANRPKKKEEALAVLDYPETKKLHKLMKMFKADDTLFRNTDSYNQFISKFEVKRKCYKPQYGEVFLVNEAFYYGIQPSCAFTSFEDAYKEFMSRLKDKDATITVNFEEGTAQGSYEDHIVVIQVIKVR